MALCAAFTRSYNRMTIRDLGPLSFFNSPCPFVPIFVYLDPRQAPNRALKLTLTECCMLSHDGMLPVRIADVPSCRPRMVADSGEILAYDSGLYQGLECAGLFSYRVEVLRSKDAYHYRSSGGLATHCGINILSVVEQAPCGPESLMEINKLTTPRSPRLTCRSIFLSLYCAIRMC